MAFLSAAVVVSIAGLIWLCASVNIHRMCLDNDMISGTKLLNITGMSRGRRENILRDVENSVRVRVGAMHLKGTW